MKQHTQYYTGVFLILFLCGGVLVALPALWRAYDETPAQTLSAMANGQAREAFETHFDQELLSYQPSVAAWGTLGYAIFGEGRKGVIVGQDGWLFTDEEWTYTPHKDQILTEKTDYIRKTVANLQQKNIQTIIVLVPAKARIYNAYTKHHAFPSYQDSVYQDVLKTLRTNDIAVVDLQTPFEKIIATQQKSPLLYFKTDTHWTPAGARIAASVTAKAATDAFPYLTYPQTSYRLHEEVARPHTGDLLRYVSDNKITHALGLKPDTLSPITAEPIAENDNLFGDENIPVTLVGTSYSANPDWGFAGLLSWALKSDVINAADEGLGPFAVMEAYMDSEALKTNPPKLLVWEIPERYILMAHTFKNDQEQE